MGKLFKKTLLGLGALSLISAGLALTLRTNSKAEVKADGGPESVTISDCSFAGSDYGKAADGTGLSVDNDANHWGKYDWTQNQNTVDLSFNAVVGTAESEFYVYLGNKQNESGCIFLIQFQSAGLMTYAYSSLNTFQNAFRWDSLGFTGAPSEYRIRLQATFDAPNRLCDASIEAVNLTRNAANVKTRTVNDIALAENFDATCTFVRLYRRGSVHDITLFDAWNKITFSDENGQTVRTVNRNEAIGTLPTPAGRLGAEFLGWFDEAGNQVSAATLSTRSMTVTAKYSLVRPFKGVTLRDVELSDEVALTANDTNKWGRYDIFAATSENRLDFSFNIKFNDCVDSSTETNGPALDIHFPNRQNDGTPKARIYFGKDALGAYLCQGSWDGFAKDWGMKFNDTDTFLLNFVVEIDGSDITMSVAATNLTTGLSGSLSRTFTMTSIPGSDYTYIRISNFSAGGVKATLTNAWSVPTKQYVKYVNGDTTSFDSVDKGAALGAERIAGEDTETKLFYRYEDENGDPAREDYAVNRDVTLTARYLDKTANGYAKQFAEKYMKPTVGTADTGTGKCISDGWYSSAKTAFNALDSDARTEFLTNSEFSDMAARLLAWAAANGDEIIGNQISARNALGVLRNSGNSGQAVLIVIGISAFLAAAGCLVLRRRKQR